MVLKSILTLIVLLSVIAYSLEIYQTNDCVPSVPKDATDNRLIFPYGSTLQRDKM